MLRSLNRSTLSVWTGATRAPNNDRDNSNRTKKSVSTDTSVVQESFIPRNAYSK